MSIKGLEPARRFFEGHRGVIDGFEIMRGIEDQALAAMRITDDG